MYIHIDNKNMTFQNKAFMRLCVTGMEHDTTLGHMKKGNELLIILGVDPCISHWMKIVNSGTPLVRPPLLHQKSGLSRVVASRQG